jgi:hypothetical protein
MPVPDTYLDAALAEITLVCHQCQASLDSEDSPSDQPRFPESNYVEALAEAAFRLGWLIEYQGLNASYFDYRILCPSCAKSAPAT